MTFLRTIGNGETPPYIMGRRVYLRPPRFADFEEWARLRAESRDFLQPWEPTWPADDLTRAAFRRRIRRYMEERRMEQSLAFFLFRHSDDVLLGGLTLSNVRRGVAQTCTLGYWMGQRYAGQGSMSAGVRAVIPYVFDVLRLRRIEAACLPENQSSIRLLEHVGFTREGLARQYLCIDGRWQDHVLYAFLKGDRMG
ncbi:MAG TPA: GNAT family protein [Candidatus Limnocylindria bacterium]|nr:GNAT family protein [Candidatus Limnocylindria bacterium]